MRRISGATWLVLLVLMLAVAGITHIVTLLIQPWRSPDDAYARVSAVTAADPRMILPAPGTTGDALPIRDPAMLTAICRFDLDRKPFRLTTSPFADGFVTVGFHDRHGVAFYGLTVQASDASSLDLVLSRASEARAQTADNPQVTVTTPEAEGFVTLSTPLGDGSDRIEAERRLQQFRCLSDPAPS